MIFGAITNSWRLQLQDQSLMDLVAQAEARGARHIELRQTCLGACESGEGDDWRPSLDGLAAVVEAYPGLTYDLAMAWPCLTRETDPQGDAWQAALEGARLVGRDSPHLRIVDPSSFDAAWESPQDISEAAWGLAGLAGEAARQGVILSMENSGQPMASMAMLVRAVRGRMPEEYRGYLGLCPDPTNQLRRFPDSDPLERPEGATPRHAQDRPFQADARRRCLAHRGRWRPGLPGDAGYPYRHGLRRPCHHGDSSRLGCLFEP